MGCSRSGPASQSPDPAPARPSGSRIWTRVPVKITSEPRGPRDMVYEVAREEWLASLRSLAVDASGEIEMPFSGESIVFQIERLPIDQRGALNADFRRFRGVPRDTNIVAEVRVALKNDEFQVVVIQDQAIDTSVDLDGGRILMTNLRFGNRGIADRPCSLVDDGVGALRADDPAAHSVLEPFSALPPRSLRIVVVPSSDYYSGTLNDIPTEAHWVALKAANGAAGVFRRDLNIELLPMLGMQTLPLSHQPWKNAQTLEQRFKAVQDHLNAEFGQDGYDIGHVLRPGHGGDGRFRTACGTGNQVASESGVGAIKDSDDIQHVVHEIAHQLNAHHAYNGACDGWDERGAFEAGLGSTLMGFHGPPASCKNAPLNPDKLAIFHEQSVHEMLAYLEHKCAPPAGAVLATPILSTAARVPLLSDEPVILKAHARGVGGEPLPVRWSELRVADATTDTSPPLYAAQSAGSEATWPRPSAYWRGPGSPAGALRFRASARDRVGGLATADVIATISSVSKLQITLPPNPSAGVPFGVRWRTVGVSDQTYETARVQLLLSRDGGKSFSTVLGAAVARDGEARVCVTGPITFGQAVIRIEARDGGFYSETPGFTLPQGPALPGCT
jgi:hypothetical protein